jgi:predicted DNA-binding transcriptional regulator AlpA
MSTMVSEEGKAAVEEARRLLNAKAVAERVQVTPRTLWRMVAAGEFPQPLRRGRKWSRWFARDVDEYLRKLEEKSRGKAGQR